MHSIVDSIRSCTVAEGMTLFEADADNGSRKTPIFVLSGRTLIPHLGRSRAHLRPNKMQLNRVVDEWEVGGTNVIVRWGRGCYITSQTDFVTSSGSL